MASHTSHARQVLDTHNFHPAKAAWSRAGREYKLTHGVLQIPKIEVPGVAWRCVLAGCTPSNITNGFRDDGHFPWNVHWVKEHPDVFRTSESFRRAAPGTAEREQEQEQLFAQLCARAATEEPSRLFASLNLAVAPGQQKMTQSVEASDRTIDAILLANAALPEKKKNGKKRSPFNQIGERHSHPVCINDPQRTGKLRARKEAEDEAKTAKKQKKEETTAREEDIVKILVKYGWMKGANRNGGVNAEALRAFAKANIGPGSALLNGRPSDLKDNDGKNLKREGLVAWFLGSLQSYRVTNPLLDLTKLGWNKAPTDFLLSKQEKAAALLARAAAYDTEANDSQGT